MKNKRENSVSKQQIMGDGWKHLSAAIILQAWVDWTRAKRQLSSPSAPVREHACGTIFEIKRFLNSSYFAVICGDNDPEYVRERFYNYDPDRNRVGTIPRVHDL